MDLKKIQEGFTPVGIRTDVKDEGPFYHGTKAVLNIGASLEAGYSSNFGEQEKSNYVYLTATIDAAIWGAELSVGKGKGRIYIVEPTGIIDDDPNLTDMRYPGNPTRSYRSRESLRIVGEVSEWQGHSGEELKKMRDGIAKAKHNGYGVIN
jgi:rifampin ADP-ribosylating transferase